MMENKPEYVCWWLAMVWLPQIRVALARVKRLNRPCNLAVCKVYDAPSF